MSSDVRDRLELLQGGGLQPHGLVLMARDGATVIGESVLPGAGRLDFEASGIRRERTGIHARIAISSEGQTAAYSVLNVERDEDRTRLANSAGKRIGGDKRGEAVKVRLDQFCHEIWPTWVRTDEGEEIPLTEGAPPVWMLEPYILEHGGTILFAPPGAAKSWTALIWAACLSSDPTDSVLPVSRDRQRNVLYVNLERGSASISWRLGMVAQATRVRPRVLGINRRGSTFSDVWDACRTTVKNKGVDLVIVDSLSRAGYGDLNANDDTNRAMDALNALGCGWLVLAHSPRADASHVFGSVMHDAAADLCVRLTSAQAPGDESRLGIRLEVTKANDVRKAAPALWEYGFDEKGLISVDRAAPDAFPDLAPTMSVGEQVYEYLRAGKATATEIANETGLERSAVAQALRRDRRFSRGGREGNKVFYCLSTQGLTPEGGAS